MNICRHLFFCAFALSSVPQLASADEAQAAAWTARRVQQGLLGPLAEFEDKASRFSRARMPPMERRVRVTQVALRTDKDGRAFMSFSIDDRYGDRWHENAIAGCAYVKSGDIFVKIGSAYRAASIFFGKRSGPVPDVCEETPGGRTPEKGGADRQAA